MQASFQTPAFNYFVGDESPVGISQYAFRFCRYYFGNTDVNSPLFRFDPAYGFQRGSIILIIE
jgi:hypothetical protein